MQTLYLMNSIWLTYLCTYITNNSLSYPPPPHPFTHITGSNPQWSRRQGSLPVQHTVYGGVLQIDSVRQEDSGYYICTATNHYGVGEQQAYLMVEASQSNCFY